MKRKALAAIMAAAMALSMVGCGGLEDQKCFAVIGATIADNFQVEMPDVSSCGANSSSLLS